MTNKNAKRSLTMIAVRLTTDQLELLDREVDRLRGASPEALRVTRSDVVRHAIVELSRREPA